MYDESVENYDRRSIKKIYDSTSTSTLFILLKIFRKLRT